MAANISPLIAGSSQQQQQQQQPPLNGSSNNALNRSTPSILGNSTISLDMSGNGYEVSPLTSSSEELFDYSQHEHSEESVSSNTLWYKEAIFYEVYVRAFCDVEGTGNGGISGITAKLDYLHSLGVDCIWLLPIYPSPLKDDGYDVADYCDIHPDYGTLNDFKVLVKAVHERNMKIIADFIPNHCSEQHKWFQEARKDRNSPFRDYFVWSDTPTKYKEARIIFLDVETSNWTFDPVAGQYYWHRFYKEQPDLNFDNPKVQQEMLNIMKFWLDLGIDGFRVDAVPYLFERDGTSCENLQETHDFLKEMRKFIDNQYPGRVILAEACQMPNEVRKYFGEGEGDEFNMGFHFPVMPRVYMSIMRGDGQCLKEIMELTPPIPATCQWVTFLRNHDELTLEMVTPDERKEMWAHYAPIPRMKINLGIRRRLAPLLDNDQRKIELAYSLLFTLPGSPIIYYGDEIGMGDNIWLEDRHGVRTPMQWDDSYPNGGFSTSRHPYSQVIDDPIYGYQRVNVKEAEKDPSSLFHIIRQMIQRRRKHMSFGHGSFTWVPTNNRHVTAYLRVFGIDRMLIIHNLTNEPQSCTLKIHKDMQTQWRTPTPTRRKDGAQQQPTQPQQPAQQPAQPHIVGPTTLSAHDVFGTSASFSTQKDLARKLLSTIDDDPQSHYLVDILTDHQCMIDTNGVVKIDLDPYQFYWFSMGELSTLGGGTASRDLRRKNNNSIDNNNNNLLINHNHHHLYRRHHINNNMTNNNINNNGNGNGNQQQQQQHKDDIIKTHSYRIMKQGDDQMISSEESTTKTESVISTITTTSTTSNNNNNNNSRLISCYSVYKQYEPKECLKDDASQERDFQKRIDTLYPPDYKDNIRQEQIQLLEQCKKGLEWSIVISDCAGIELALQQLKKYINLKYPLSKADYEYYIITLFNLLYDGKVNSIDNSIMAFLIILLIHGKKLIDIVIDWVPLFNMFRKYYNYNIVPQTMLNEHVSNDINKYKRNIHSLIIASRPFFSINAFEEIMEQVKPLLCPHSNTVFVGLFTMTVMLPTHHLASHTSIPSFAYEFLSYWEWIENNNDWDERWLMLLSRVIKHSINVNWTELAPRLYTHFIRVVDLSIGNPKFAHLKPLKNNIPVAIKITRDENIEFTTMGRTIASLINYQGDTLDLVNRFFSSISSYFHPSNHGEWSISLLELIISTCHSFTKKHLKQPFNQEIIKRFYADIFPHVEITLYSKKKNNILNTCKIVKELCYIAPQIILPNLLEKLYGSIDKEEVNRIVSELEVISTCFHPLIVQPELFPEGKSHVYNLMVLALNNMDPIHPNKASAAFKFFNRIFSCVLLNDETIYLTDTNNSNEFDTSATLATSSFLDWSLLFLDSVLNFIRNASTKKEFAEHKRVTPPGVFLHETIGLFFCQMSDEVYNAVLEKLVHFFKKTFEPDYYKQYSAFLCAATLRNPTKSLATLLPVFISKLFTKQQDAQGSNKYQIRDLSDEEYKWYIQLMGYTVFKSGAALLNHQDEFIKICNVLFESNNKVIIKQVSKVVRKSIFSLTRYYPSNNRSIPTPLFVEKVNHTKYWGITDESIIYPIEWFQPVCQNKLNRELYTKETTEFSKRLIELYLIERVDRLDKYIDEISTHSILRTAVFLMNDDDLKPAKIDDSCKYIYPRMVPSHGRITIESIKNEPQHIYRVIRRLLDFVQSQKNEEISVLKGISKCLLSLNYGFLDIQDRTSEALFSKWKNLKRYKTRNAIIFKGYKAHLLRQTIASEKLPLTNTTQSSLFDLLGLSVHRYKQLRAVAQDALTRVAQHHVGGVSSILPKLVENFTQQRSDEEIKGSIYLMCNKNVLKKLKTNWKWIQSLSNTFINSFDSKFKTTTRETFVKFKHQFILSKYEPVLIYHSSNQMMDLDHYSPTSSMPSKDILSKQKSWFEKKNLANIEYLRQIVENIIDRLKVHEKKDNLTWKDLIFLQTFMIYLIATFIKSISSSDQDQLKSALLGSIVITPQQQANNNGGGGIGVFGEVLVKNISMIKDSIISIFKNMNSDYPITRILSINLISQILFEQKKGTREICFEHFWNNDETAVAADEKMDIDRNGNDGDQEMEQARDDNNNEYSVLLCDEEDNLIMKSLSSIIVPSIQSVFDDQFLDKLVSYIIQDHDVESQSHNIGCAISAKNLSLLWPNSRHPVGAKLFKLQNAKLFYSFFAWNEQFYPRLVKQIEALKLKNDKEDQSMLAEMVAGLGRYVTSGKHSDHFNKQDAINYLTDLLLTCLNNCSNELNETWILVIRFISYNTKIADLNWLVEILFKLYNNPLNIFSQAKSIRFFKALVFEITYKSTDLLDKFMKICLKEFSNPHKQVRDEVYKLFVNVLIYQSKFLNQDNTRVLILEPPILPNESIQTFSSIVAECTNQSLTTEVRNSVKETFIAMVSSAFSKGFSNIMMRITPSMLPTLFSFTSDTNQDISKSAMMCIASMAQGFYLDQQVLSQLIQQLQTIAQSSFWRVRRSILPFVQIMYFNHALFLSSEQSDAFFDLVLALIRDTQIEVRELGKDTLASMLVSSKTNLTRISKFIETSIKGLKNSKITNENVTQKHQYILILSSIILSSPYQIPSYFPPIMECLSGYSSAMPPIRDTVQSTLSEFWRTHKSTWEEEKLLFNEEQREMIRGTVAYPSYYA
ncbi:proteasome activator complex subunit 4 [Cavenderia fasciculata]|uniref:maltose alpha-D-glucosyltransferase n=1 Tax=Cavenderia fasciculata TaxID=261658 RepID=F4PT70_CACFS|nr:proteasome activator complex subunit 4 [Cavenderia fasciculata]EGG20806.1 proteasome activator complex subunit 4 [Cavenderia fasciculata]|eukprot:XP_004358656.1 proteasome activator complex subunit 4 [Cavenderia fasciculata]